MEKIFVNITSYLDTGLVDTLGDLFRKADNPSELRVVVINKACEGDKDTQGVNYPELEVYNSPLDESPIKSNLKGQSKMKGEKIYFQCDPHSRFVDGWDTFIRQTVKPKTLFNPATMSFEIKNCEETYNDTPVCFQVYEFNPQDIAVTYGVSCAEYRQKAFFCSNCVFCYSDWLKEVPIDERIYNWGDEVDRSIRTLMAGWKIFNTKPILWHDWKGVGEGRRGGRVRKGHEQENEAAYEVLRKKLFGKEEKLPWDLKFYMQEMRRLKI